MQTPGLERTNVLVTFKSGVRIKEAGQTPKSDVARDERASRLVNTGIRGFIERAKIAVQKDKDDIESFNIGCGKQADFGKATLNRTLVNQGFGDADRYQGYSSEKRCDRIGPNDPNCGGRYSNYFRNPVAPADVSVGDDVLYLTNSSTGVRGPSLNVDGAEGAAASGIPRVVIRLDRTLKQYDQMTYLDPNMPCTRRPSALWVVGDANSSAPRGGRRTDATVQHMYGWTLLKQPPRPEQPARSCPPDTVEPNPPNTN